MRKFLKAEIFGLWSVRHQSTFPESLTSWVVAGRGGCRRLSHLGVLFEEREESRQGEENRGSRRYQQQFGRFFFKRGRVILIGEIREEE